MYKVTAKDFGLQEFEHELVKFKIIGNPFINPDEIFITSQMWKYMKDCFPDIDDFDLRAGSR